MRASRIGILILSVLLLSSCGNPDRKQVDKVAREQLHAWAVANDYPYEIVKSNIVVTGDHAFAGYVVSVDYKLLGAYNYPMYVTFDVASFGDEWRAELTIGRPVFDVTLMNYSGGASCDDVENRTPSSSPCLHITNTSTFDWEIERTSFAYNYPRGGVGGTSASAVSVTGERGTDIPAHQSAEFYLRGGTWNDLDRGDLRLSTYDEFYRGTIVVVPYP